METSWPFNVIILILNALYLCRTLRGLVHSASWVKSKDVSRRRTVREHKQPCHMPWTVSSPQHLQLRWWVRQVQQHTDQQSLWAFVLYLLQNILNYLATDMLLSLIAFLFSILFSLFLALVRNITQIHVAPIESLRLRCKWMTWRASWCAI